MRTTALAGVWVAFSLLVASAAQASQFPSGDGHKISPEEVARLTELGKKISTLNKEQSTKLWSQRPPLPTEFAVVLNNGYGRADDYPKTVEKFEQLLISMTNSGYNTLYAPYKEWRAPLMRKHGVKMMIDILAWGDDAQCDIRDPRMWQRPRVKEICERVRNDRAVWGYNMFNDPIHDYFKAGGDMNAHISYLKLWDGTHPMWVGTKYTHSLGWIGGSPGVIAWYDYHWQRGFAFHYNHCRALAFMNEERDCYMGRWEYVCGVNQLLYTAHQSMAWGLKTMIWFIGWSWDSRAQRWNPNHPFCQASRQLQPLYQELGKIGRPIAHKDEKGAIKLLEVFSTPEMDPATQAPKVDPKTGHIKIVGGWTPFPSNHWAQIKSGSVVAGFFKYPNADDAIFIANHDAGKPQEVVIDFSNRKKTDRSSFGVSLFDKPTRTWKELPLKNNSAEIKLAPAGGELVAVGPKVRQSPRTAAEIKPTTDTDWANNALYVGYDLERSDLKAASAVYTSIVGKATDAQAKKKAGIRLAWINTQLPRETEAMAAYEKLLASSKGLGQPPDLANPDATAAWQKTHAAAVAKLQEGVKALYEKLPDTMGGAQARALLETYGAEYWKPAPPPTAAPEAKK